MIFEEFVCGKSIAGDMDSLNLYDKYDPILEFNNKDYKLAVQFLKNLIYDWNIFKNNILPLSYFIRHSNEVN